jgi:hypothetical protein
MKPETKKGSILTMKHKKQFQSALARLRRKGVPTETMWCLIDNLPTAIATLSPDTVTGETYAFIDGDDLDNFVLIIAVGGADNYEQLVFDHSTGAFLKKETHQEVELKLAMLEAGMDPYAPLSQLIVDAICASPEAGAS